MARRALALFLVLSLLAAFPAAQGRGQAKLSAQARPPAGPYAGWAVEAYPEASAAEMEATVRRLVDHGANVVWIGHNNPGEVDAGKVEPGLSYAVYEAYLDSADPRHDDAVAMVEAQHRMLAACRAAGVRAVLPVGYQIQMGQRWNGAHPGDVRRDAEGRPLDIYGGGVSASFYAPAYRADIERYYGWVDAEFARPYADVILMLNLADEPLGGDYSAHAEAEFRRRHGFGFDDVGDDPARQRLLGAFQSRYVVEYANYSAGLWQALHPSLPVTMSFDGAQARQTLTLPDVEALFRDTPANFIVTFDAYPHDGLPHVALSDTNLVGLFLLARSLGLYSARYQKPVWLWAAANSWGLSQASPDPGTVSDAVANGLSLALLVRQGGGDLQGIAYWNYSVKEQGLYNDTHETAYEVETMFQQVSAVLPTLRQLMATPASSPEVLVLAPPARAHEAIGARQAAVLLEVFPLRRLAMLARPGVNAAVVGSLVDWGPSPLGLGRLTDWVRVVVALAPAPDYLAEGDLALLREFLAQGGQVVTSPGVAQALAGVTEGEPALLYGGLVARQGGLYVAQRGIAVLFEDARHDLLVDFWREVLGLEEVQPGYRIVTGDYVLHYHLGPAAPVWLRLPFPAYGYRYDEEAQPTERLYGSSLAVTLGRREYVFLQRDRQAWPWLVREFHHGGTENLTNPLCRRVAVSLWLRIGQFRRVGKEGGDTARVPEQDALKVAELALAHQGDEAGHGFAGVHRVQEDALGAGQEADRLGLNLGQDGVAGAGETVVDVHVGRTQGQLLAQALGGGRQQGVHPGAQLAAGLVDTDAQHLPLVAADFGADDEPGLGAARAAGKDHAVERQLGLVHLVPQLLKGQGIGRGAQVIGAAVGDDVGPAPGLPLGRGRRFQSVQRVLAAAPM